MARNTSICKESVRWRQKQFSFDQKSQSLIKLQQQIAMQSGTVLHLALLKKLSNHYPTGELNSKYHHFRKDCATRNTSRSPQYPLADKYQPNQRSKQLSDAPKARNNRMEKKFQRIMDGWQFTDSLTAWKIDNQQQVSYTDKLKRDKYQFFPKLSERERNNMSKKKIKKNVSVQEVTGKDSNILNILLKEVNTKAHNNLWIDSDRPSTRVRSKNHHSQDKENKIELRPSITGFTSTRRTKSNDRSITARPMARNNTKTLILND